MRSFIEALTMTESANVPNFRTGKFDLIYDESGELIAENISVADAKKVIAKIAEGVTHIDVDKENSYILFDGRLLRGYTKLVKDMDMVKESGGLSEASGQYHGTMFKLTRSEAAAFSLGMIAAGARAGEHAVVDGGGHFVSDALMKRAQSVHKAKVSSLSDSMPGTMDFSTDEFKKD